MKGANAKETSKIVQEVEDIQRMVRESCGLAGEGSALASLLARIQTKVSKAIHTIKLAEEGEKKDQKQRAQKEPDMADLCRKVDEIHKACSGGGTGAPKLWSHVAAEPTRHPVVNTRTVELRVEEMEGAVPDAPGERLQRIQKVIPEAEAVIPHPRNGRKVTAVLPSEGTRDRVLREGLKDAGGVKLIRRPIMAIVQGVPLHADIKNGKCEENEQWIAEAKKANGGGIERVGWLYSTKDLKKIREKQDRKRGSILLTFTTERERDHIVANGFKKDGLWHPAEVWDVSMTDEQCFRCYKWGHRQAVCNAPKEKCGYCAGDHASRECKTTEKEHYSCAGCKKKGHTAWTKSVCPEFEKFKRAKEGLRQELRKKTLEIQRRAYAVRESIRFQGVGPAAGEGEWSVVTGTKKRRVGRPRDAPAPTPTRNASAESNPPSTQ